MITSRSTPFYFISLNLVFKMKNFSNRLKQFSWMLSTLKVNLHFQSVMSIDRKFLFKPSHFEYRSNSLSPGELAYISLVSRIQSLFAI